MQHLFLMEFFGRGQSGRSYAVTERVRVFKALQKNVRLVTFDYNPQYNDIWQAVAPYLEATHLNMMAYYQGDAIAGGVRVERLHDHQQVTLVDRVFNQSDRLVGEIYYGLDNKTVSRRVAILYNTDGSERIRLLYQQNKVAQVHFWQAGQLQVMSFTALVRQFLQEITAQEPSVIYADVLEEEMTQAYLGVSNAVAKVAYIHADHHVGQHQILVGFRNLLRSRQFDWIVTGTHNQAVDVQTEWQCRTADIAPASITVPKSVTALADRRAMSVVVVTRFDRIKRVEDMIAAVVQAHQQNRDINLQLYGTITDQAYYTQLQKQVTDAHASNYITFNGPTTDAVATFQTGQLTVFTSRTEGFGRTLLEALAAGTPVVSYDIDYGPRAVIGKGGKLVSDGRVDLLANALVMGLADRHWREQASEAARQQATQYDAPHITAKWADLIAELEHYDENNAD